MNKLLTTAALAAALVAGGAVQSARATLIVTLTDVGTGTTTVLTDSVIPNSVSFAGNFGNFSLDTLTVNTNVPGGADAENDTTNFAVRNGNAGSDTLVVDILSFSFTSPSGSPLVMTSKETSSTILFPTDATETYTSELQSPVGVPTGANAPLVLTFANHSPQSDSVQAPNPANAFAIHNTFTVLLGSGERVQGEGTTDVTAVPEPGSLLIFGSALLGLGAAARRRRKDRV